MNYKVTVIVPIYNVATHIDKCVRSLMEQTLQEIEYIFVDDKSLDDSINILYSIIDQYPQRKQDITIIHHAQNRGVAAARNTGLEQAHGDYIIYCDSDDWIDKDMYAKMYNAAIDQHADMILCDFNMEYLEKTERHNTIDIQDNKIEDLRHFISYGWTIICNIMAKRSIYKKYNIKYSEGYDFCEDFGVSVKVFYHASTIGRVHEALYHYNKTNEISLVKRSLDNNQLLKTTYSQMHIYDEVIRLFQKENVFDQLEEVLSWRVLSGKRGLLFNFKKRDEYMQFYPEADKYIDSNPLCSKKDKICQKCITKPYWRLILGPLKLLDKWKKR